MNACSISGTWWQMSISSGASFFFPLLCIPGLRQHPDLMASFSSNWRALSFPFLSDNAVLTSSPSPFPLQPHSMKADGGNAVGHKPKPLRIEKYIRRCLKKIYMYIYPWQMILTDFHILSANNQPSHNNCCQQLLTQQSILVVVHTSFQVFPADGRRWPVYLGSPNILTRYMYVIFAYENNCIGQPNPKILE